MSSAPANAETGWQLVEETASPPVGEPELGVTGTGETSGNHGGTGSFPIGGGDDKAPRKDGEEGA